MFLKHINTTCKDCLQKNELFIYHMQVVINVVNREIHLYGQFGGRGW